MYLCSTLYRLLYSFGDLNCLEDQNPSGVQLDPCGPSNSGTDSTTFVASTSARSGRAATSAAREVGPSKPTPNTLSYNWVDRSIAWAPSTTIGQEAELSNLNESHQQIKKFLQPITNPPLDGKKLLSVDSAAASVLRYAAGQIQKLSTAYNRCRESSKSFDNSGISMFIRGIETRIASKVVEILMKDEDDIFFEGGQAMVQFQAGVLNGTISSTFLEAIASVCHTSEERNAYQKILQMSFRLVKCDFKDTTSMAPHLYRLDVLTQSPTSLYVLASTLLQEVKSYSSSGSSNTRSFEESSILKELFSVSTLVESENFSSKVQSCLQPVLMSLRGYPKNRKEVESTQMCARKMLEEAHVASFQILMRLVKYKLADGSPVGRESALTWLAAVATISASRTKGGDRQAFSKSANTLSDKFTLGALSVALRFCRPFFKGEAKFLQRLHYNFYTTERHRFGGGSREQSLAGCSADANFGKASMWFSPDRDEALAPHFVAEVFFLTQRLVHVALIPGINRYANMCALLDKKQHRSEESGHAQEQIRESILKDSGTTQILDPVFAGDAVKFMVLQAQWLGQFIINKDYDGFNYIPESVVQDIGTWLVFVINQGSALLLGDTNIAILMETLVLLIEHHTLVKSPLVLSKIVDLMLAMLSPQLVGRSRSRLSRTFTRPGEDALVAAVLGSGAAQERLVPALMRLYSATDHVIGLDVDRDKFDKFSVRHSIDLILEQLWKDDVCRRSLTLLAQRSVNDGETGVLVQYIGSVLNDLMYLLKDCFDRLSDIHNIEESMKNESEWSKLDKDELLKKTDFYEGQRATCKGFMRLSVTTLRLLILLSSDVHVVQYFLKQPLSGRAAYGILRFLELLAGPGYTWIGLE